MKKKKKKDPPNFLSFDFGSSNYFDTVLLRLSNPTHSYAVFDHDIEADVGLIILFKEHVERSSKLCFKSCPLEYYKSGIESGNGDTKTGL